MTGEERQAIVEGLAVLAVSMAGMGRSEQDTRVALVREMAHLGETDISLLREAADAVERLPPPPREPAEKAENAGAVREDRDGEGDEEQRAAALKAREWLQRLADYLLNNSQRA